MYYQYNKISRGVYFCPGGLKRRAQWPALRLYIAVDEEYISPGEFKDGYEQARRTFNVLGDSDRACYRSCFINYLKKYEERK